jgi:hypothetical protein
LLIPFSIYRGAAGDEFLNFKTLDYDGENLRSLKEDLIGRIGIENILILLEIIFEDHQLFSSTMMGKGNLVA